MIIYLKRYTFLFISLFILIFINLKIAYAQTVDNNHYFTALKQIQALPKGATKIAALNIKEKKQLLKIIKHQHISGLNSLKMDSQGNVYDEYGESVTIYKGDFNNDGVKEYAFNIQGGSMPTNVVLVFKLKNHQLINLHLSKVIINSLLPNEDMSQFYLNTATPFAIQKNGKVYLRFMRFPYKAYDKSKLLLCTYIWQNNKIRLVGPNLTFDKLGRLVSAKDCI